jgi:hypothetical protein
LLPFLLEIPACYLDDVLLLLLYVETIYFEERLLSVFVLYDEED